MPDVKLPLSGNVTQTINPWTIFLGLGNGQVGLMNVNLGNSSNPATEQQVLSDVASYGKQIGRISDVLEVLLAHFHPPRPLKPAEEKSIRDLKRMLEEIAEVRSRHSASRNGASGILHAVSG